MSDPEFPPEVESALAVVERWLGAEVAEWRKRYPRKEPAVAELARDAAFRVLDAGEADGVGGCQLCQS